MLYHFKKIIFVFLFINVTGVYSQIVINEVNHRPTDAAPCPTNPTTGAPTCQGLVGTGREFVELYNPTCNAFDLSGFIIASRSDVVGNDYGGAFRFPAGASIPPNGIVSFGSGDAGAPAVTYGYNAAPAGDKRVGPKGWLLPNTEGWVALYRPNGTCYQLVYYASSGEGTACITNGSSEFLQNPLVPTNSGAITLLSANAVFTSTPAVCQYIGPYASPNLSMARVPDGGTWQTNRAATPTACNSTCNVISTINFTASVSQPTCGNNNGSITLNVTSAGAATFSWSPNPSPTNTTSSTTANNLSATSYTISVTQSGCTKDTIITLTATGKPNAGSDQTGVCGGTSATLTGTSPTTGTWSAQSSNPTGATLGSTVGGISSVAFAANASGVYNFIYSSSGCTDTMNITVNPKPNAGSDQTNVCAGTSATLTGTNPTTGTWTAQTGNPAGATLGSTAGGIAAVVYATSSSGVYNFIYTANGCSDTMNITVTAKPNAGIDQTVNCFITGTATMAGSGTGTWSFATGNAGTATITTLNSATTTVTNFSTSGTYNLVWTNNGCSDTARITVNNSCACPITNNNLTAPVSPNCAPYNGTTINGSTATPAGGTYTWQYSNGGGFANASGTNNTEDYTTGVLPSNTHQFRRIYTTTSGIICSDTSNVVTIVVNAKPNAGIDQTVNCFITGTATMAGSGAGSWSFATGNAGTATITTLNSATTTVTNFSTSGTYNLVWTNNGCSDTARITVNNSCACPITNNNLTAPVSPNCAPYNGTTINGSTATPAGGTYTWQYSNGGGFANASGTNNTEDYTTGVLPSNTHQFRRIYTTTSGIICSDTSNVVTILVNAKPNAGIDQTVNCFITGTATMAGSGTGTWSFATGNAGTATITSTNSATTTVTNFSTSGTYNLVWTNNGCSDTARITVNNSCACPITNNNLTAPVSPNCAPYNGTTINGSAATPAGGTYTWQYSNGGGFANASGTNNTEDYTTGVLPSNTHQFRRIYTTTSGIICSDTSNVVTIVVNAKPNAGIDQTVNCFITGTATMAGSGTGTWSFATGNAGTATITTSNSATTTVTNFSTSGTYNLVWTNNGCSDTARITVNNSCACPITNNNLTAPVSPNCAPYNGTTINGSTATPAGGTYTWQYSNGGGFANASGTNNTEDYTTGVLPSNTHQFRRIYTTTSGIICSDTSNVVTIVVNAKPNAGIDQTVNCFITGTATMAGSGTGTWSFATGNAGTASITSINSPTTTVTNFSASGTYNLVWTNNGCSDTARITVNNSCACPITNNNLTAPVSPNCAPYNGTTINGSAATPAGGTYTWQYSNGGGFANASGTNNTEDYATGVLPSNTHQFRRIYTTTSGIICSDTSNVVTIVVNAKPNANAGLNKVLTCTNPTVTLDGSSTTTGVSYSWTGPGIVSGGSIATPVVNASGTYTLTVTVNSTNCQQTDNVDVTSNGALPNADAGLNKVITCTNPTVILDGSSTTSGVSYAWTGPGVVSGGATAKPTVNAAGAYTLTVTITATGCQQTDIVNVTNNTTLPNANAGSDKILTCILTDVLLDGSSTTSGVSYAWTGPGIVSGGATATPDVNKSGIYTLTVTNPVSGCKNTDQVEVFNNGTLPNADAGLDKELTCTKTSVILDGSSTTTGVTYTWIGPGILSGASSATPTVNTTGTYTVTVTETATGCKKTDQVLVTKNTALPNINAGNPKVLTCTATTVLLNGSSSTISANPSWAGPGIINGQTTFTPTINTSGTYTLTMTDTINGCVASASVLVTTDTLPPVLTIISSKNPAEYNEIINLTLNSNATISAVQWQPAALVSDSLATQVSAQISSPTTFIVNATDSKGCSGTTSLFVNLFNVDCIYVPNTFTPDANGKNEVFKPLGSKLKTISIFRIFDRWGNMVFETTDVSQGWDGTYKGKLLEPGVYVYYIEGTCITNNKEIIKGDVTLIR